MATHRPTIMDKKFIWCYRQGSQKQEVKFQDPIFRKFQDNFVGFTGKMHVFLSS